MPSGSQHDSFHDVFYRVVNDVFLEMGPFSRQEKVHLVQGVQELADAVRLLVAKYQNKRAPVKDLRESKLLLRGDGNLLKLVSKGMVRRTKEFLKCFGKKSNIIDDAKIDIWQLRQAVSNPTFCYIFGNGSPRVVSLEHLASLINQANRNKNLRKKIKDDGFINVAYVRDRQGILRFVYFRWVKKERKWVFDVRDPDKVKWLDSHARLIVSD